MSSLRLVVAAALAVAILSGGVLAAQQSTNRANAESKLEAIKDARHRKLAAEPIQQTRKALQRAEDARAAGDQYHGAMLDALALQWAEMADALVRAAELESKAAEMQRKLAEAETKSIRAKALLEETVARRGRAREKLERLQQQSDAAASGRKRGGKP